MHLVSVRLHRYHGTVDHAIVRIFFRVTVVGFVSLVSANVRVILMERIVVGVNQIGTEQNVIFTAIARLTTTMTQLA